MSWTAFTRFSPVNSRRVITMAVVAGSLLYPVLVYVGRDAVPPAGFVGIVLAIVLIRLASRHHPVLVSWRLPLGGVAVGVLALAFLDMTLAVRAYPVLMSLGAGLLFAWSLKHPPSLIERFARLQQPILSPEGIRWCRGVTAIWSIFLLLNAGVAGGIALWGSLALWSVWTGAISYVLMGLLFAGEIALRHLILKP